MLACMLSHFRHLQLFATVWIVAHQPPLFVGFSRQEHWIGLHALLQGNLPDPGIELASAFVSCIAGGLFTH